jgi:CTD small phosphatase-like protein 2
MGSSSIWLKDLRVLYRVSLKDMIIIDNSVLSFAIHINNGIPILPYYDNKYDNELLSLEKHLKLLSKASDIR